jgi:hypothetical protein
MAKAEMMIFFIVHYVLLFNFYVLSSLFPSGGAVVILHSKNRMWIVASHMYDNHYLVNFAKLQEAPVADNSQK